jgi:F-type H+-transporting ATPase subunit b
MSKKLTGLTGMAAAAAMVLLPAGMALAQEGAQAAASAEHEPGLVELNVASIVWVIVFFLIVVAVLYKAAWKNVLAGLKAREDRIRKDISDAEAARARAEQTLQEYKEKLNQAQAEVQALLAQATQQAERIAANVKEQAAKEAEDTKSRAVRDIEAARDQAVSEVHAHAADLATTVASKILRRNINPQDQQDLVNESLQQLQSVGARG